MGESARILIVDDDRAFCRTLELALGRRGYETETAWTGKQALEKAGEGPFHLAFVDVHLPDIDGTDLLAPLKRMHREMEVILITGFGSVETVVQALNEGATAYLTKPVDMDDLFARTRQAVEKQRLVAQARQAQEALRENEERFRTVADFAHDWEYWVDPEGRHVYVSPSCERITGYRPDEFLENRGLLTEITHPDDRPAVSGHVREELESEDALFLEFRIITRGGEERWIGHVCQAVHGIDGRDIGRRASNRDITEHRRLEEKMRRLQKLESLGAMAGGTAHDLNNLLHVILGNASVALMHVSPEDPTYKFLEEIERAARRGGELGNQMLACSGHGRFVLEEIDLSKLIEKMMDLLERAVPKKIDTTYDLAEGLPAIEGDAPQVRQILTNLIANASEAIGDREGAICVRTLVREVSREVLAATYVDDDLPPGRYVCLEVSDTGCGMDEETRAKAFDPFFSTREVGRGLGLAAVLGGVRAHEGAIEVDSAPGRGTTFEILLPALDYGVPVSSDEPPVEEVEWKGSGTVLVVDDERSVRDLTQLMLEDMGLTVLTAPDGREAVDVFREHSEEIACVLLDLTMPHMGGEEALHELQRIRPDIQVVLSSGYGEEDIANRFVGRGLAGVIQKPYTLDALRERMKAVLEASGE